MHRKPRELTGGPRSGPIKVRTWFCSSHHHDAKKVNVGTITLTLAQAIGGTFEQFFDAAVVVDSEIVYWVYGRDARNASGGPMGVPVGVPVYGELPKIPIPAPASSRLAKRPFNKDKDTPTYAQVKGRLQAKPTHPDHTSVQPLQTIPQPYQQITSSYQQTTSSYQQTTSRPNPITALTTVTMRIHKKGEADEIRLFLSIYRTSGYQATWTKLSNAELWTNRDRIKDALKYVPVDEPKQVAVELYLQYS